MMMSPALDRLLVTRTGVFGFGVSVILMRTRPMSGNTLERIRETATEDPNRCSGHRLTTCLCQLCHLIGVHQLRSLVQKFLHLIKNEYPFLSQETPQQSQTKYSDVVLRLNCCL